MENSGSDGLVFMSGGEHSALGTPLHGVRCRTWNIEGPPTWTFANPENARKERAHGRSRTTARGVRRRERESGCPSLETRMRKSTKGKIFPLSRNASRMRFPYWDAFRVRGPERRSTPPTKRTKKLKNVPPGTPVSRTKKCTKKTKKTKKQKSMFDSVFLGVPTPHYYQKKRNKPRTP